MSYPAQAEGLINIIKLDQFLFTGCQILIACIKTTQNSMFTHFFFFFFFFFFRYKKCHPLEKKRHLKFKHRILSCFYNAVKTWSFEQESVKLLNYKMITVFLKHGIFRKWMKLFLNYQLILWYIRLHFYRNS